MTEAIRRMAGVSERVRERLEAIIQKTYDEHGLKNRAWGVTKEGKCLYAAGCAVGVSLTPETALRCDNQPSAYIGQLLRQYDATGTVTTELFGSRDPVPEAAVQVLVEVQNLHDTFGTSEIDEEDLYDDYRAAYRSELVKLTEIWGLKPPKGEPCPSLDLSPTA